MLSPQLTLGLHNEIFIDNFAGGGGASTGIERGLRRAVDHALNHDRRALAMHRMNHPMTEHHCEDILHADPLKIAGTRRVGAVWFSPDCKHFSKAKGGKPRSKKIRGLAWSVVHWVNVLGRRPSGGKPRVLYLENVEEFQTWCPLRPNGTPSAWRKGWFFRCFIGALRRRGYTVEWRELRACNYGAPTIRKRLFLIARCDGQPITWPEATHAAPELARRPLKPYRTMAECIDFSLPCPSIFLTREEARALRCIRPLAKSTLARVAKGVDRYVLRAKRPFIVELTHQGNAGVASIDQPVKTLTAANRGERALVSPVIAHAQHGGAVRPADAPLHTIAASAKDQNQLMAASIVKLRGDPASHAPGHPVDLPGHTISAGGTHHGVIAAYVAQHNGGANGHQTIGHPADSPASTISSKGSQQQLVGCTAVPYYGSEDEGCGVDEPTRTVTTRDRFGVAPCIGAPYPLSPEHEAGARRVAAFLREHGVEFEGEFATVTICGEAFVIVDIGMRMLKPRELYLAQGFPRAYIIDRGLDLDEQSGRVREVILTGTEQVRMVGNSVSPPMAEALIRANMPELILEEVAA